VGHRADTRGTIAVLAGIGLEQPDELAYVLRRQVRIGDEGQDRTGPYALGDKLAASEKVGLAIKMAHPVVQVSVYDSVEGGQTIIGTEKA
jgi:hypothetical protein